MAAPTPIHPDFFSHSLSRLTSHIVGHTAASNKPGVLNNPAPPYNIPAPKIFFKLSSFHTRPNAPTVRSKKNNSALAILPSNSGKVVNKAKIAVGQTRHRETFQNTATVATPHSISMNLNQNCFPSATTASVYISGGLLS